jgi:hypothetical protein
MYLQLIEQANNRLQDTRVLLSDYDRAEWHNVIRLMNTRSYFEERIENMQRVKIRLIAAYKRVLKDIVYEAHRQGIYSPKEGILC